MSELKLPQFPNSKLLEIVDRLYVESVTNKYEPYSDFNFTSLLAWNTQDKIELSDLSGNLVVKFQDYSSDAMFYSLLGETDLARAAQTILQHSIASGCGAKLQLVPETVASKLPTERFRIEESPDDRDYILSIEDQIDKIKKSKRKKLNQFTSDNPDAEIRTLDLRSLECRQDILGVFHRWEASRNRERTDTQSELTALQRLLKASDQLDILATGLFAGGKLVGFSLDELLDDTYSIGHFEKANTNIVGAFQYLQNETFKVLQAKGSKLINIEQDLGIEGLRASKMAYGPVKFLAKYNVELI